MTTIPADVLAALPLDASCHRPGGPYPEAGERVVAVEHLSDLACRVALLRPGLARVVTLTRATIDHGYRMSDGVALAVAPLTPRPQRCGLTGPTFHLVKRDGPGMGAPLTVHGIGDPLTPLQL